MYCYEMKGKVNVFRSNKPSTNIIKEKEGFLMKKTIIRTILTLIVVLSVAVTALSVPSAAATTNTTWFSQGSSSAGTGWTSTNLNYLYFPNLAYCSDCGSTTLYKCRNTPFYTTSSFSASSNQLNKGHINKWGCNITSIAMILRNMGATTSSNRTDFRTNTTGRLSADPFTVAMSNMSWPTVTKVNSTRYEITSYTDQGGPTYTYWATAVSGFGKSAYKVDLSGKTAKEKADILAYYINKNPEGILVRVGNSHSVVFTKTTHPIPSTISADPILLSVENETVIAMEEWIAEQNAVMPIAISATSYDSLFTCYDPGTSTSTKGNGVTYDNSWAYSQYGGIDQVNYLYYFD